MRATGGSWKSARSFALAAIDSRGQNAIIVVLFLFRFLLLLLLSVLVFLTLYHFVFLRLFLFIVDPVTRRLAEVITARELPAANDAATPIAHFGAGDVPGHVLS